MGATKLYLFGYCCLVIWLPSTTAHSYLSKPPARNVVAADTCKHCLQSGGPNTVKARGGNVWPTRLAPGSHGLCGDPVQGQEVVPFKDEPYLKAGPVQATYTAGSIVEFQIGISTHHMGHYEFRICDQAIDPDNFENAQEGQACLDKWVLHRAPPAADCQPNGPADCQPLDERHPERWYLPPPNYQPSSSLLEEAASALMQTAGEYHTMRYIIPANLTCTHCTLQWYWATGNSCLYDEDYIYHFKNMKSLGWNADSWAPQAVASWAKKKNVACGPDGKNVFGEEFWNCADIKVNPAIFSPTPLPSPSPAVQPVPSAVTSTTARTSMPGPCSAVWQQCGGIGWAGYTCCQSENYCNEQNEYYHQCLPGRKPGPVPSPVPVATTTTIQQPSPPSPLPAPSPSSSGGSCSCEMASAWDGRFSQFATGGSFCSQNFGGANPYISAGGGSGSSGGFSGAEPCTSGQYSFSEDGAWTISMSAGQAKGMAPYRAFAYAQFCNGQQYSNCWDSQETQSFSFSLMVSGVEQIGAYVKLLFWTDSGNILGLLPPNHPKGNGALRLITFMNDDYPNSWQDEHQIDSDTQYHVQVDFTPITQAVSISINGVQLSLGSISVNMLAASNGPQIGIYSFDFGGGSWPSQPVKVYFSDACIGKTSGTCPSGSVTSTSTSQSAAGPATTTLQGTTIGTTMTVQVTTTRVPTTEAPTSTRISSIMTNAPRTSTTGLTSTVTGDFFPINGAAAQACRGATSSDNLAEYYQVSSEGSLENCKVLCRSVLSCKGIEYHTRGRCEVWTREDGIEATYPLNGYTCLRYNPGAATTSLTTTDAMYTSCGQLHESCGGKDGAYQGPTCCVSGLKCKQHSSSYSQCVKDETSGHSCSQLYEQCGGKSWKGFQCCSEGLVCVWGNKHFSQCLRRPGSLLQEGRRLLAEARPAIRKPRLRSSKIMLPLELSPSFLQQKSHLDVTSITQDDAEL